MLCETVIHDEIVLQINRGRNSPIAAYTKEIKTSTSLAEIKIRENTVMKNPYTIKKENNFWNKKKVEPLSAVYNLNMSYLSFIIL